MNRRNKMDDELTPFQLSQLKFLRQQVDRFQEERWTKGNPRAENDFFEARQELTNFVENLRGAGKLI